MRINNIGIMPENCIELFECIGSESKSSQDLVRKGNNNNKPERLAIVKYHKNGYFGLLDEYLANGWIDEGDVIKHKGIAIAKTVFALQEGYYVIAFVSLYPNENQTQLEAVEDRLLYISEEDQNDFFKVYKYADKTLILEN